MKTNIRLWLSAILVVGCSDRAVIQDNSTVIVYPGLGISNICAVGMTYEQIRKATGDAKVIKEGWWSWRRLIPGRRELRWISVPSLCATMPFETNKPISSVSFEVSTNQWNKIMFRGKVGEKLSFKDGPVSREQVEAAFGSVKTNFGLNSYPTRLPNMKEPYAFKVNEGWIDISYPAQGITFTIYSNVVIRFYVRKVPSPGQ